MIHVPGHEQMVNGSQMKQVECVSVPEENNTWVKFRENPTSIIVLVMNEYWKQI